MIELKNVSKYYSTEGTITLGLRNINLKLNKNEIVAIVGDSGSGKSTLLNVICGVDGYEEGEMYFNGNETSYFNQNDMDLYRKNNVGFIFQNYNIIDSYTVLDNVMLPLVLNGKSIKEAKQRALELVNSVGLIDRINNKGTELSGGEKQRCVIARALASDCQILACDEPTGNLDSKSSKEIIDIIKSVAKDKLVLIVTHNYEEVRDIATRTIKMADGEIVEDYSVNDVETSECTTTMEVLIDKNIRFLNVLQLAFKNLISTPKKTFFIFFVFFIVSIISLYLYLSCVSSSQVSVYNPDSAFKNYEYNRLVVFNYDHSPITDKDLNVSGEFYENAFYEDILFSVEVAHHDVVRDTKINVTYSRHDMIHTHLLGSETDEFEYVYLIVPENELDRYSLLISDYVGGYIKIQNKRLKFIGVGYSSNIEEPVLQSNTNLEDIVCSIVLRIYISLDIYIPSLEEKISVIRNYQTVSKPTLYLPEFYREYANEIEYEFIINKIYPMMIPSDIDFYFTPGKGNIYFSLPNNYSPKFDDVYEYVIYADKPNEAVERLESKGLTVVRPSIEYADISQNQLLYIAYVVISTVIVIVLGFVSYAVLFKVYVSKNKDYTILRTLGVPKKQMINIVRLEMLILALIAVLMAFIVIHILYYFIRIDFLNVVTYNSFDTTLLYLLIMFLFAFFLANRFNKKIFRFSIQTTLKREDTKND